MDDARRTITGPLHPLIADYRTAKRQRNTFLARNREWAAALVREHARHGESYSSTIRTHPIRHEGPSEDTGGLAQMDGFVTVYDFDLRGSPDIANMYADYTGKGWPQGGAHQRGWHARLDAITARVHPDRTVRRYEKLVHTSREAASQVAIMFAIGAASEHLEWDTGESINAAATRICMNMAQSLTGFVDTDAIVNAVREDFGQTRTIAQFARNYLDNKVMILAKLEELEIGVGGKQLPTSDAALMAKISPSTWRAYVARGTAPPADDTSNARTPRWRALTVAAWMAARTS